MVKFSSKSVQLHSKASQGEESLRSNGAGRHSFARAPIELHIAFTLNKSLPFNGKFGASVEKTRRFTAQRAFRSGCWDR